jgi:hypothetical protein
VELDICSDVGPGVLSIDVGCCKYRAMLFVKDTKMGNHCVENSVVVAGVELAIGDVCQLICSWLTRDGQCVAWYHEEFVESCFIWWKIVRVGLPESCSECMHSSLLHSQKHV